MIEHMASAWRRYCAMDHHKSRDYYWYISITYDGAHEDGKSVCVPKYQASHNGYIANALERPERDSLEEAYQDLIDMLIEAFEDELEWSKRVLNGPEEYDKFDHQRAQAAKNIFPSLIRDYRTSGGR